jgi:hypothetical protein
MSERAELQSEFVEKVSANFAKLTPSGANTNFFGPHRLFGV